MTLLYSIYWHFQDRLGCHEIFKENVRELQKLPYIESVQSETIGLAAGMNCFLLENSILTKFVLNYNYAYT